MDIEDKLEKMISELPETLHPKIKLSQANEPISIYKGKFEFILKERVIEVDGEIIFSWKPDSRVIFNGLSKLAPLLLKEPIEKIQIPGTDLETGNLQILHASNEKVIGLISAPFVIKYSDEEVDCIGFELANFKKTFGENIKKINHTGRFFSRARMEWADKEYLITIDKLFDFDNVYDQLRIDGGYALTHTGKIALKEGNVSHKQGRAICEKLGLFLSFIKGRRSYPCFLHGFKNDKLCWIDYSAFHTDRYKDVDSWLPQSDYSGIAKMWEVFLSLTNNEDDYQCVDYLIHWYIEANNNSGFVEGSIVLLQNAFELLHNWRINPDKLQSNGDADEKIRKLLVAAQLPLGFHEEYAEMVQDLKSKQVNFKDFPKLFTLIRNAIVHSDLKKRSQLSKYSGIYRFYIKHIGLYHLELLLLHLFGYNGKIASRLPLERYSGGNEEFVPWVRLGKQKLIIK